MLTQGNVRSSLLPLWYRRCWIKIFFAWHNRHEWLLARFPCNKRRCSLGTKERENSVELFQIFQARRVKVACFISFRFLTSFFPALYCVYYGLTTWNYNWCLDPCSSWARENVQGISYLLRTSKISRGILAGLSKWKVSRCGCCRTLLWSHPCKYPLRWLFKAWSSFTNACLRLWVHSTKSSLISFLQSMDHNVGNESAAPAHNPTHSLSI